MTAVEFALWMNGAADLCGDKPPTPEQWAAMREKLGETVGKIVSDKLLERATDLQKQRDEELGALRQRIFSYQKMYTAGALYGAAAPAPVDITMLGNHPTEGIVTKLKAALNK